MTGVQTCALPIKNLCKTHYMRQFRHGTTELLFCPWKKYGQSYTAADRFHERVYKTKNCWFWIGALEGHGYGSFRPDDKVWYAHRYAYVLAHGSIPEGFFVLHKCDIPTCVNPDHLFLGTSVDNNRDTVSKGRNNKNSHREIQDVAAGG